MDRMQSLLEILSEVRGFKEILSSQKTVYSRTCMLYFYKEYRSKKQVVLQERTENYSYSPDKKAHSLLLWASDLL